MRASNLRQLPTNNVIFRLKGVLPTLHYFPPKLTISFLISHSVANPIWMSEGHDMSLLYISTIPFDLQFPGNIVFKRGEHND